jgi:photosystem II stability/assembly factor-like uncharacterized protein
MIKKQYFSLLWLLLWSFSAFAQEENPFEGVKARLVGPSAMSGRVAVVTGVNNDPNLLLVGTATGGIWKSENAGTTWTPIFDEQSTSSIGAIAVDPNNDNVIWVGTGEANVRNSAGVGRGVFKSPDGGKTWQHLGLEKTERISRLHLDNTNPQIAYVAAMGTTWGENPERGVYKTTDGGKTWKRILFVDERTGAADMAIDPKNPNKLIVSMWEHRRFPWSFNSGGKGSGIYITSDGGENWKKMTVKDGMPEGELGRAGIAFAPSNSKVVYALVEAKKSVLLKSTDGGYKWETISDKEGINPRPFYYADIRVNPTNENTVYRLQTTLDVSIDGGANFKTVYPYTSIHPDHHDLWIHPEGKFMAVANDGGIGLSFDGGGKWQFVENLPLGQFYHIAVDNEFPYNIYGGLQDNGSWRGPSNTFKRDGIYNGSWELVAFGDGFATVPDPEDADYGYAMSQGGYLMYFNHKTAERRTIRPTESDIKHRYNWNAAIAIDPFDKSTVYYGSQFVHKTTNKGQSWEIISPDLTTNDPSKQKNTESGGLTRDVTAAENHTTILSISPSPVKQGVIWVGTDDGNVQVTRDGGKSWTLASASLVSGKKPQIPAGTWVPHVEASNFDEGTAYVVFDDHRRSNWTTYVFVTRDFGKTWQSISTKDIDGFAHVIRQDPKDKNLLFVGTEFGLFISFDEGKNWMKFKNNFPTVPVTDLVIHPRENDLVIGTHGRSIYVIDDITPFRNFSKEVFSKKVHLFPVSTSYQYNTSFWAGSYITPGDALFKGDQRPYGALLTFSINPPDSLAVKIGTPKEDKITIQIFDDKGTVIRNINTAYKKGLNRATWDLTQKGFNTPTLEDPKADAAEKSGIFVLPGTYTVKIKYLDEEVTQQVVVKSDPRIPVKEEDLKANYELRLQHGFMYETLSQAVKEIKATRKTIATVNGFSANLEAEKVNEIKKAGAELDKKLSELLFSIIPDNTRQGIFDRSAEMSAQIGESLGMIGDYHAPTQASQVKLAKVKQELGKTLNKVNALYNNEVAAYQKLVKDAGFEIFKEVKPIVFAE